MLGGGEWRYSATSSYPQPYNYVLVINAMNRSLSTNGQDAASAHGLSQRGCTHNNSAATITCTLSCTVRRHSSWLTAQKQDIPEVKNRVGHAHKNNYTRTVCQSCVCCCFDVTSGRWRLPAVKTCTDMRAHQSLIPPPRDPFLGQPCHY